MDLNQLISSTKRSIPTIEVFIPKDQNQVTLSIRGTGFFIDKKGIVATCAHVYDQVPDTEKGSLFVNYFKSSNGKLDSYERSKISLLAEDRDLDIAILKVDDPKQEFQTITFGDSDLLEAGEEVASVGFPLAIEIINLGLGLTLMANKCIIGNVKPNLKGEVAAFLLNSYAAPGSSGSPLFSLNNGKVVGWMAQNIDNTYVNVNQSIKALNVPQMISIARPINSMKGFLERNKI